VSDDLRLGDCLELMRAMPDDSVDLVMTSPPYEDARTYGISFRLRGQQWVDWAVERYLECLRVCRGLVVWVVEGKTRGFRYSATPALLMADLHRLGVHLRKPAVFHRVGISGSGGPDWLRNDWEFCVCAGPGGKLPWSANTAMGHPPKWAPGGEMSHRLSDGTRRNQWGANGSTNSRRRSGKREKNGVRPSHVLATPSETQRRNGHDGSGSYKPPVLANPGNVIHCAVGGGVMGSRLCHENEAPFPERLAEFFVRSFCPPLGVVLDPFCGSGTTLAVAERWGRDWIGMECREDQIALSRRRIAEVRTELGLEV
jgi:hypothetical protein